MGDRRNAADAIGRLGGPCVQCAACDQMLFEHEAYYMRRLWLGKNGTPPPAVEATKGEHVLQYACSLTCAGQLEERAFIEAKRLVLGYALWIDDAHL